MPKTTTATQFLTKNPTKSYICTRCLREPMPRSNIFSSSSPLRSTRQRASQQRRHQSTNPADEPGFTSIVDNPPVLIRSGRKHNYLGLSILAAIPIISFGLGCWQVQRLGWKSELIAKFEDRLIREPLPLPPRIDPDAIKEFDYRRVYAQGKFRHDQEMLIGPRLHDGKDGYLVVTPLERTDEPSEKGERADRGSTTILVNRGWIPKDKASRESRSEGLPTGDVVVQGLLREPWKKNMFTPENVPEDGKWYFPDVAQMARHTGSQAVWIEETMKSDLLLAYDREAKGVPLGRAAEVNLRNNHTQ
jgi:surfeit locus 1 family protein